MLKIMCATALSILCASSTMAQTEFARPLQESAIPPAAQQAAPGLGADAASGIICDAARLGLTRPETYVAGVKAQKVKGEWRWEGTLTRRSDCTWRFVGRLIGEADRGRSMFVTRTGGFGVNSAGQICAYENPVPGLSPGTPLYCHSNGRMWGSFFYPGFPTAQVR